MARPDNYDGYAHVLLDEAQDVSPMQWRMLGRRGRQASWTIVGDAAQSAWPDAAEARRAREEALRGKQVRRFHLGTNYRNSAEIYEYAASVVRPAVPDADLPIAVRRTGIPPEHRTVPADDLDAGGRGRGRRVARRRRGDGGSHRADGPARRRRPAPGGLGPSAGPGPDGRVQVVDGLRSKGMEYDGVVVVAPDEIVAESPAGIRVLYVALTRATHRLVTLSIGTPPAEPRRRRRGAKR